MIHDSHLILLIVNALRKECTLPELREVFQKIERFGRMRRYRRAYETYARFMGFVMRNLEDVEEMRAEVPADTGFLVDLVAEPWMSSVPLRRMIAGRPQWQRTWRALLEACEPEDQATTFPVVALSCDGSTLVEIPIGPTEKRFEMNDVQPGRYTLALAGGRVLWARDITRELTYLRRTGAGTPLPLAAATDGEGLSPGVTLSVSLLDDQLRLQLEPGYAGAHLTLTFCGLGGGAV